MAVPETPAPSSPPETPAGSPRSKDEVALELMKFIVVTTGYGRSTSSGAGFSSKPSARSAEEHADALFELFERCRRVVSKD
jgi:hypothetical protein